MKQLLLLAIRLYWLMVPKANRRRCLFRLSCSHHVYQQTEAEGWRSGLKALKFRFQNCRTGFHLFHHPMSGCLQMILPCGQMITEADMSERFAESKH